MPDLRPLVLPFLVVLTACADPSLPDPPGRPTALLDAAERGDLKQIDSMLAAADVDSRDACQWTPLMKAAVNGHTGVAVRLLGAGARADLSDKGQYSPLLLAASNGHHEIVRLLLDHGAGIDHAETTQGFTALIWAAKRGHLETVELLLQRGADRSLRDGEGFTALGRALSEGHEDIAERLQLHSTSSADVGPQPAG